MTKASNDDFTRPFKLLKDLSNQTIIDLGKLKTKTTLEHIKTYLTQALDSCVVHVVNNTWKVKGVHGVFEDITCWNCGKPGHDLRLCPEPRNQDRIDKARAAFCKSRTLRIPSLEVPGGVGLNTHKESLENLLLVVRQFDSLTTNPTRGVLPVDGSLLTPPSFMTSRVPARVPLSFTTNIL